MNKQVRFITYYLLLITCFCSCRDDNFTPRPRGFYRIAFPHKEYRTFNSPSCPFTFNYPIYAEVVLDTDRMSEPCWMNVEYPQFRGTLYLSYKSVRNDLDKYTQDFYTLADKHIPKASGMRDIVINVPDHHVYGIFYEIKGPAASPTQFFVTDSVHHFVRCSLYFYAVPQPDSIAPVLEFVNKDIDEMINSFRWK
jgi:gliding motility-associated lipoprotein GldD